VAEEPTFTVVMPAYNAAETIGSAIQSALAQTRGDFELVVADDESNDTTVEIAESFTSDPRVRIVLCQHGGLAATRNAVLAVARGRYFSLLDSDDLWMPNYLEVMGETLGRHPDAGFAYTDAWKFDDATRRFSRWTAMGRAHPPDPPPTDPSVFFAEMLRRNFVWVGVTIRRTAVETVGPFNADLRSSEDYELWLRMLAHGLRGARAPGILGISRLRRGSLSSDPVWMSQSVLRVYTGLSEDSSLPEWARADLRARRDEAQRQHEALVRLLSSRKSYFGLRPHLVSLKQTLLRQTEWLPSPPAEVSSVFPDPRAL
jgi:glycosyltransferase involved in cell wall biosynthesis